MERSPELRAAQRELLVLEPFEDALGPVVRTDEDAPIPVLSDLSRGHNPGAAASSMKIRGSETSQKIDHLGIEALAWYAAPFEPEARLLGHNEPTVTPDYGITAMPLYLNNRAATIYAGSNEIQRNIIAKAVLGL